MRLSRKRSCPRGDVVGIDHHLASAAEPILARPRLIERPYVRRKPPSRAIRKFEGDRAGVYIGNLADELFAVDHVVVSVDVGSSGSADRHATDPRCMARRTLGSHWSWA